jgi:zinc/manganese transport system permease protein
MIWRSGAYGFYADRVGPRLAIGWTMGTVVSALGIYLSVQLDLPTGAAMVCTFGIVLVVMAALKPLLQRAGGASAAETARG